MYVMYAMYVMYVICMYVCLSVCLYVCMYVCMHACVCSHFGSSRGALRAMPGASGGPPPLSRPSAGTMSGQAAQKKQEDAVAEEAGGEDAVAQKKQEDAMSAKPPAPTTVDYICGNCGLGVKMKLQDAVRCRECGYRVLFKKRAQKPMQYHAV